MSRFQVEGDPNVASFGLTSLQLPSDVTLARLTHRATLLRHVDAQRERLAALACSRRVAACQQRALRMLTADAVRQAFDLGQESPALRERYGRNIVGQSVLLARRLVEAGARMVNVNVGDQQNEWYWDDHKGVFSGHRKRLPPFDGAFSTLIDDLHDRGLLDSTLVISVGEFGRTPKINPDAGRDHWPDCYTAILAGGGVPGGLSHGSSDKIGAFPAADPVTPGDLTATLFTRFGLDPATELADPTGRRYRLSEGTAIAAFL